MKRFLIKVSIVLFVLLMLATPALAQDGELPDFTDLRSTLLWLAGASIVAANFIFGKLLESWSFWRDNVPRWLKYIIPPIFAVVVSFAAKYILSAYPGLIDAVQPYYGLVVSILLGWFGSQYAHSLAQQKKLGAG